MEIELNTGNLRNLCRICLGRGDYNLWEHKVQWSDNETENDSLESDTQDPAAITIHEVLQMYNDWQVSLQRALVNNIQIFPNYSIQYLNLTLNFN